MSVVIVGVIRRKPVLTHASIVCEGMLASVNSVNSVNKLKLDCRVTKMSFRNFHQWRAVMHVFRLLANAQRRDSIIR